MIEVAELTKRFGSTTAVDDLSFSVEPGVVTGFLGPNGAGKTTTMRMILGLDRPDSGRATIGGTPYRDLRYPMRTVGAVLDAKAVHPNRTARNHLRWLAAANDIPVRRVDEVLEFVGLADVAGRKAGGFSLGMAQRLGLAAALLGDPEVLLLDEPINGLDPEGIRWVRGLMQSLAADGRTVLVSSHLLSEMALSAEHLVVIGRGKLIAQTETQDFIAQHSTQTTVVRSPKLPELATALEAEGFGVDKHGEGSTQALHVPGQPPERVGEVAFKAGLPLSELSAQHASLEDAYLHTTVDAVQYQSEHPAQPANQEG